MKMKLLITSACLLAVAAGCGDGSDKSNMDTTTDSMNTMTTYPSDTTGAGMYGNSGDSANYNNRNLSADDSAGVKGAGSQHTDSGSNH